MLTCERKDLHVSHGDSLSCKKDEHKTYFQRVSLRTRGFVLLLLSFYSFFFLRKGILQHLDLVCWTESSSLGARRIVSVMFQTYDLTGGRDDAHP